MKKFMPLVFILIFGMNVYSQIIFEKGYFIDNSGKKTECLIKNMDWRNNPKSFEYKLSENAEGKKLTIEYVQEFGIYDISKYVRNTVKIDRSSGNIDEMSYLSDPEFKEELLFLKVLVEGKANLYYYRDGDIKRYFYSLDNSVPEQLIHKKYLVDLKIGENNKFRHQLWENLNCRDALLKNFESLQYTKKDLVGYFVEYNQCENVEIVSFDNKKNRDWFNLSIRPGLNNSSLSIEELDYPLTADFGNKLTFRIGIEVEFILPFNKNKWGIFVEPTYQYYNQEKGIAFFGYSKRKVPVKVKYKSIEFPIGLRHYFFLNKNSKIFANIAYVIDLTWNSLIDFEARKGGDLEISTGNNIGIGIGYKHNEKYSLELRYQTSREVVGYLFWDTKYRTFSVILGYTIF